ncbi:putative FAD-binding monooxygenase [Talaromyces proteolyticus]|uniref:FAD-binding monooxygenase n=1 Tax=Talaromyces proteolyticus TaxID=1131652 RepID=A0AAD4KT84_9EURO|nr:putative FAD-binding monooxygenase [Talaromyces proteolyticus]KAH8700483.1 putative FAD-binding monooxygenase [Talaromyces proteolyticus]
MDNNMPPLKILICGAGITGTALSFWLSKLGHEITVIERFPVLRTTGLQVDLRGFGITVLKRMGLEESFRAVAANEQGVRLVDKKGRSWGYFPAHNNPSAKGPQSFTSDFEIMRGDLCQMLHDASKDRVKYRFGVHVQRIDQTAAQFADVKFSDGTKERFDLVVGADGQWSGTRKIMLEEGKAGGRDPLQSIGVFAGYFTVNEKMREGDGFDATIYVATQGRGIMTRRHDIDKYQAYLFCKTEASVKLKSSRTEDFEDEKEALEEVFRGAGWRSEEVMEGMRKSEDFYCERIGVVVLNKWSRGRIALVGDAAYCPSAMTGMGTSCGIAGAYVLAGEIARHCGDGSGDAADKGRSITAALDGYERKFRPLMDRMQKGLRDNPNYMDQFPSSTLGLGVMYLIFWITSLLRLDVLARMVLREDTKGWKLPEYPELDETKVR